jgi:hypothetical protein
MTKRLLFARIGYMQYYAGLQKGDEKPKHGGSYNKNKIGHEVFNFKPARDAVYGFFQPYLKRGAEITLSLGRIDPAAATADALENVLVVFVSRSDIRGQVVVGWYNNATVFREYQEPRPKMLRENYFFIIKAKAADAVLLPEKLRTYSIPKGIGAFGRASVVYPYEANGEARNISAGKYKWIGNAIDYVSSYDGPNLVKNPLANLEDKIGEIAENERASRSGQGFQVNSEMRRQIEIYAVERAKRHFRNQKYEVEYVGQNRSYDLKCTRGSDLLRVEVKGTQADGSSVILTPNEVFNAREHKMALYVLHSIRWRRIGKSLRTYGGSELVFNPWTIDQDGELTPLSFTYEIRRK